MPNTSVFTGADGSITLAPPAGAEGDKAKEVLDEFELTTVGRVNSVRVEVTSDVKAYHEIGHRYASELRPGNMHIRGTIGRAYINGAMLRLLMGEAYSGAPATSWTQPALNITLLLANSANEGVNNTLTLHNVKLDSWVYEIPEDDFVLESVGFQAVHLTVADEG